MTVISVATSDAGRPGTRWEVPADPQLINSPIPRASRRYGGSIAVPALGANDETNVQISLLFPTAFVYLPKSLTIEFVSDDLTTEFSNLGQLEYHPDGDGSFGSRLSYETFCDGPGFRIAAKSIQIFRPQGTWRHWINGPTSTIMVLRLADISGDTSTAGDVAWTGDFWEYDIAQCLNYPINTPIQSASYY